MVTVPPSKRKFINVNFTMSYEEHDRGFTMPEYHFHNDFEIYILESGHRTVYLNDREINTIPGDALLIAPEVPHKSRGRQGFSGICVHFSRRFLKQYFTENTIQNLLKLFTEEKIRLTADQVKELRGITHEFVIDREYNFLKLIHIFELLYNASHTTAVDSSRLPESKTASPQKADCILAYVDEHYAHIHNLNELTELFQISEGYLFKLFRKKHQMTPKTYINKLKIRNICNRLKYSSLPIKNIASDYGYESYEHFCRTFKKEMGCTPSQYKQRCKT